MPCSPDLTIITCHPSWPWQEEMIAVAPLSGGDVKLEEIADVVAFLASERASFITGALIGVDGGQTAGI